MRHIPLKLLFVFISTFLSCQSSKPISEVDSDKFKKIEDFPSRFVEPRDVEIYFPPGYELNIAQKYPVLYMHDGQNLFHEKGSYAGEWKVDENMEQLISENKIEPCIVVGIWNTEQTRFPEYMPQEGFELFPEEMQKEVVDFTGGVRPFSDNYLKFLVKELKPYIDENYPTKTDQKNTLIAGSSMGGLISLYGICKYPEVFGAAACLSTHWPIDVEGRTDVMGDILVEYFSENLPAPSSHKIFFDFGTKTLDRFYEPFQIKMDEKMREAGYVENENWLTKKYPGDDHSEKSWSKRLDLPLIFLLGDNDGN